jgi:hypothetical protein
VEGSPSAESQAVYRFFSEEGQLLYIGRTGRLGSRLSEHGQKIWFPDVYGITLEWYSTEQQACAAEEQHIHIERPKYNIVHANTGPDLRPRKGTRRSDRIRLWEGLREAPPDGVHPRALIMSSGLSNGLVYDVIAGWRAEGKVMRISQGGYRLAPDWQQKSWDGTESIPRSTEGAA